LWVLGFAVLAQSCCDPRSVHIRFVYNGQHSGRVFAVQRAAPGSNYQFSQHVAQGVTLADMRAQFSGEGCAPLGTNFGLIARDHFEAGAQITAWIDMDGDDMQRCRTATTDESPGTRVLDTCQPEPGDPIGKTPWPLTGDRMVLEVRDPNQT
jgi:hypothetical protein